MRRKVVGRGRSDPYRVRLQRIEHLAPALGGDGAVDLALRIVRLCARHLKGDAPREGIRAGPPREQCLVERLRENLRDARAPHRASRDAVAL